MSKPVIDIENFNKRLEILLDYWNEHGDFFNNAEIFLVINDGQSEVSQYSKTSQIQTWLFGYEFAKTALIFTKEKLLIATSTSKAKIIEPITSASSKIPVQLLAFGKEEESIKEKLTEAAETLEKYISSSIGIFAKEKIKGKFHNLFLKIKEEKGLTYEEVDISLGIALALSKKDEKEMKFLRSSSRSSSQIMKNIFLDEMTSHIDQEKKITHEQLSNKLDSVLFKEKELRKAKLPTEIDSSLLDWSYAPIIQSGGKFDLKPSAVSNQENLTSGIIICSLGVRYSNYCSNIGRTFLIDPTSEQEKNYAFLMELQKYTLSVIKPSLVFKDLYDSIAAYILEKRPDLDGKLTKNCGFVTGIEFRESTLIISPKNTQSISEDMVLCLSLGLQDLSDSAIKSEKLKNYSLQLIDTVRVTKDGAVILTDVLKEASDVTYFLDNQNNEQKSNGNSTKKKSDVSIPAAPAKTAILKSKFRSEDQEETPEQKRREHQRELFLAKQEEGLRRFKGDGDSFKNNQNETFKHFESYKRETALPDEANKLSVIVDQRGESIIVPINGLPVPFHISTIKNVSKNDEGEYVYLRLNFLTPGQGVAKKEELPFEDPNAHFLRSLTFRSTDTFRLTETYRKILDLKKEVAKKEIEKKDMAEVVKQDKLRVIEGRVHRLPDVFMRPQPEGKRMPGEIEIHANGLRYKHPRSNQNIDILFSNTKHIFFQPCENEVIVLIHIHLIDPIMIGKRKTKDVQFFREASDAQFDETGNRRRGAMYGDDDEIEAEREERRRIKALNDEFKAFANKISDATRRRIEVETPFREIGFTGVPFRANVFLMPTGDCLVHLSDPPFLVITLSEVEIVHLERVQFGLKNFDMAFVFKDFSKPPIHINTIPMKQLDPVKEWLDSVDVVYTEGPVNLNWGAIMKTIRDDPVAFFEDGGWSFLDPKGEDGEESSEESASEFEIDSEELNASSSESEFETESEESSGGDDDFSEGDDWDELEEKAARDDKRKRVGEERNGPPHGKQKKRH